MTIFGATWEDLSLDHVEAYLADADDESLIWEAKATKVTPYDVRREVCGFANGGEIAYLILGAHQENGAWHLKGVPIPHREPATWVSTVLGEAISPRPVFRAQSWARSVGDVVVVEVEPVAAPPCIANGTVYERLPGLTRPIRDSVLLHDLVGRGHAAHRAAADVTIQAIPATLGLSSPSAAAGGSVAVCRVGYAVDFGQRLFRKKTAEGIDAVLRDHLGAMDVDAVNHRQDFIRLVAGSDPPATWWQVTANTRGLIRLDWSVEPGEVVWGPRTLVEGPVGSCLHAGLAVSELLGGSGPSYAALQAVTNQTGLTRFKIVREAVQGPFDDEILAGMVRELERSSGLVVYEPEGRNG